MRKCRRPAVPEQPVERRKCSGRGRGETKKVKPVAARQEQRCPACGRKFTVDSATSKKKVRCPKCRAIVALTEVAAPNAVQGEEAAPIAPPGEDWKAQCAILQARIEALVKQIELRKSVAPPNWPAFDVTQPPPDSSALKRAQLMPRAQPAEKSETPSESGIDSPTERGPLAAQAGESRGSSDNPRSPPPHEITLLLGVGDVAGRRIVETLKAVVARAGWRIRAVIEKQLAPECRQGLTLATDPTLSREQLTATFRALRIAGFSVNLRLDPQLGPVESVLLIGAETFENRVGS